MKVSKKHVTVKPNLKKSKNIKIKEATNVSASSRLNDAGDDISVAQVNKTQLDKSKELILSAIENLSEYVISCTELDSSTRTKLKDSIANLSVIMLDLS